MADTTFELSQDPLGITLSIEQAAALSDPSLKVFAPASGQKKDYIVSKISSLASSGTELSSVLVAVNTDADARELRNRLIAKGIPADGGPQILTPLCVFQQQLEATDASLLDGRSPRYLVRAEFNIVLEDMKARGYSSQTLRMLLGQLKTRFSNSRCTANAYTDAKVVEASEDLFAYLKQMGVCLREEYPILVLSLRKSPQATPAPFSHVLIDDAQNLCPATIEALASLANIQSIIVGNPNEARPGFDPCFVEGSFETCLDGNRFREVALSAGNETNAAANALAQTLWNVNPANASYCVPTIIPTENERTAVTHIKWREPEDEFKGVVRYAYNLLSSDPLLLPKDIFICVPNRLWAGKIEQELDRRHMPWQAMFGDDAVSGDPRSDERLDTLKAYAALALASTPKLAWAWRFWLALGKEDLNVSAWKVLADTCSNSHLDICDVLLKTSQGVACSIEIDEGMREKLHEANEIIASLSSKTGLVLAGYLRKTWDTPRMRSVLQTLEGSEDVSETFKLIQTQSSLPCFADRPSLIGIGSPLATHGLSPKHVIVCGLIDGILPPVLISDDNPSADIIRTHHRRALATIVGNAQDDVVLCSAQRADIGAAQAMRIPAERTRRYQGRDVAIFARSSFIDEAEDSLSGTVSGEQFFIDTEERA